MISVAPVAGWESLWLYCDLVPYDSDDLGPREADEQAIGKNAVAFATGPGDMIDCLWFNRATGTGEQDEIVGDGSLFDPEVDASGIIADPGDATGADITIAAYYCPAGAIATDDLIATCTQRASGLDFALLTETDTVATQTSDTEGDIFFEDAPPNDYGIAAALPAGYGEPIVFCYVADPIGNVFEGQQDLIFGDQIRLRLGDGFSAECAWYNVPAQGPDTGPNVYIQARKCGEGIEITSSMTVFEAEQLCGVVYQNKEFQVLLNDQVIATKQTNDDPLSSGQVFFTKLPAPNGGGIYGITTTLDEGEQTLGVFCDQNYGGEVFRTVTTTVTDGNWIDQELLEGWTLRCSWFIEINPLLGGTVPAESPQLDPTSMAATEQATLGTVPATQAALDPTSMAATEAAIPPVPAITVRAWLCPPEVVSQRVVLADVCIVPGEGITFDVSVDGEPSSTQATGEDGEIAIPVEAGPATYLIKNQPKPGHSDPEVTCTITHVDRTTEQVGGFLTADSPGQEIDFDGESEVVCIFYFLIDPNALRAGDPAQGIVAAPVAATPEDPAAGESDEEGSAGDAPHTLTLEFRSCPEGTDFDTDRDQLAEVCPVESGERSFLLTLDGLSSGETLTGPGTWEFQGPTVDFDIGAGVTSKVGCSSDWAEGTEGDARMPAASSLDGGMLTIDVPPAVTTVSCNWYIFPT